MFIEHLPRAAQGNHTYVMRAQCWSLDLAIIISAKRQSHTEEYGIVHRGSNHIRKSTKEYGILHEERIIRIYRRNSSFMNVKVIMQVAYMSAFRPSFRLNGSFARVLVTDTHTRTRTRTRTRTHTHTHTHTHHSTPVQARGSKSLNYNSLRNKQL